MANGTSRISGNRALLPLVAALLVGAALAVSGPATANHLDVTAVQGSAFGYWSDQISLFGGPHQPDRGPTPTVTLAPDASNSPQQATAPSGLVQYGPAVLFTSDTLRVTTMGTLGVGGSVTSTSSVDNINKSTTQPTVTGSEIFTATNVSGTATAGEPGLSGSTTITGGIVDTHSNSFNCTDPFVAGCGGHTHTPDNPLTPLDESLGQVAVPTNPPVNYAIEGHVHLDNNTTDYYVIVFNEQIVNPDGSITVNPVHTYYGYDLVPNPNGAYVDASGNRYDVVELPPYTQGGPILHGHLYIGQVTAGVVATPITTTSTAPTTTSTAPTTTSTAPTTTSTAPTTTSTAPTTTSTAPTTTSTAPTTTSTAPTTTSTAPTTTSTAPTTTSTAPTTTSTAPTTTSTAPTTTSTAPTTTSTAPTTTSTTSTTVVSTTTTAAPTTTTTVVGECKPGWGRGDKKHCHTGPPGRAGRGLSGQNVADNETPGTTAGTMLVFGAVIAGVWLALRRRAE